jgi:hypothetical protein
VTNSKLSVQLYTVREAMAEDMPGTVQRIADIGFTQVEPYNFDSVEGLGEALKKAGLTAPTTHAHWVGEDDDRLNAVFSAAGDLGIATVIDPHVPAERWQTAESVIRAKSTQPRSLRRNTASSPGTTITLTSLRPSSTARRRSNFSNAISRPRLCSKSTRTGLLSGGRIPWRC